MRYKQQNKQGIKKFTFHVRESGRRVKHGEGEGKGQKDNDRGKSEHPKNSFNTRIHQHCEKINQSFMPSEACRMRCAEFRNKEAATHFNGHVDKLKEITFTV